MKLLIKNVNLNLKRMDFSVKRVAKALFYLAAIATMVLLWSTVWAAFEFINDSADDFLGDDTGQDADSVVCNVQGIGLHGGLATYIPPDGRDADGAPSDDQSASEDIIYGVEAAEKDAEIKAILLEVDSYGGFPVAAEEVANALKRAAKPTVALIREGGASAAYYAATGADTIFASINSDVGGIGVSSSYLDASRKNQLEGLTYVPLSSGKFKDTGDPNKPLSNEEKALLMRDVNTLHQNFVRAVAENRNLDIQKVEDLADGSTMLGGLALENGLIDRIGGEFEVKEYLKEKIGGDVEICW